jgi:ferredoxin
MFQLNSVEQKSSISFAQKQALSFAIPDTNNTCAFVTLQLDGKPTTAPRGNRLLNILRDNQVTVLEACGGKGRCATCHVFVEKGMDCLSPPTEQEMLTLSLMQIDQSNARLACQCLVDDSGVVLEMPNWRSR